MNWGLKQGMLGRDQQTLVPSALALGPNTYAARHDFFKMVGAAILLHAVVLTIAGLWPEEKVTDIPVRALNFKIGPGNRIAAFGAPLGVGAPVQPQQPVAQPAPAPARTTSQSWRAAPKPSYAPQPVKQPKLIPLVPPSQRQQPKENAWGLPVPSPAPALAPLPTPTPAPAPAPQPAPSALPDTSVLTHAAIAPQPQRFIREQGAAYGAPNGAIGGQGTTTTLTQETVQQVREKYELALSGWIQQHKLYPTGAAGREGRVVVRMRIDRTGYVRYYAIEQSSGSDVLDAAAIDMIRRANPVPAVPATYPAGNLIEFLIPIVFRVPR